MTSLLGLCGSTRRIVTNSINASNTNNEFPSTESASNRFEMQHLMTSPGHDERIESKPIPYVEKNEYNDLQFFEMKYKLNIAVVDLSTGKIMRRRQTSKQPLTSKKCSLKRVASV